MIPIRQRWSAFDAAPWSRLLYRCYAQRLPSVATGNETQCPTMNDGGCSCYWNSTTCAMNSSDCSGVGITSVGDNCTLTGGEVVTDGWSGKDTGTNWCNSCSCGQGMLACTEIGCIDPDANGTLQTSKCRSICCRGGCFDHVSALPRGVADLCSAQHLRYMLPT